MLIVFPFGIEGMAPRPSPKENRTIPPRYEEVWRRSPNDQIVIEINGGTGALAEVEEHLAHVDTMIGRQPMTVRPIQRFDARFSRDIAGGRMKW